MMRTFLITLVLLLSTVTAAAAQNGKTGTWTVTWTPDSGITQACSSTVASNCALSFQLFQQLGSSPAPSTDPLVTSPPITSISSNGQYTFIQSYKAGTYTFYVTACIKDNTGVTNCSVPGATTGATFRPNQASVAVTVQ